MVLTKEPSLHKRAIESPMKNSHFRLHGIISISKKQRSLPAIESPLKRAILTCMVLISIGKRQRNLPYHKGAVVSPLKKSHSHLHGINLHWQKAKEPSSY
jgi:hypothetical protein